MDAGIEDFRASRGIFDTRISDELLYSGGGIPREEQGNDEETSKAERGRQIT